MGNPKTAIVTTSEGDVTVHKLVISQYAELLALFETMPAILNQVGLSNKEDWNDSSKVGAQVPVLLVKALPEMAKLLAFPTDQEAEFFMQLDLADILDVVDAILTVNDYDRIVTSIKKIRGRVGSQSQPAATSTIGSTAP